MRGIIIPPTIKKSLKWLILALLIVLLLGFSVVFADDLEIDDSSDITDSEPSRVEVLLEQIAGSLSETPDNGQIDIEPYENYTVNQLRISSSDTSGLHAILLSLIGDYNPIVTDHEYRTGTSQYTSHSIDIQPDWSWIMTAVLFIVVLYCFFRLLGLVLGGK